MWSHEGLSLLLIHSFSKYLLTPTPDHGPGSELLEGAGCTHAAHHHYGRCFWHQKAVVEEQCPR